MSLETTGLRVSAHTLGCKLNYAETSSLAAEFVQRGYRQVPFGSETDVFLLNTCSVTENAEKECRQLIRRVKRQSPDASIVVTGCYAQLRPEEIAKIEGVDLVLGSKEKFDLFRHFDPSDRSSAPTVRVSQIAETIEFHGATTSESDERTRAFLKVQDGCDYTCSFCTIPKARGESRSATIDEVVRRAGLLCEEGFHEIVLSGVNVGDFGRKTGTSFFELAKALEADNAITARIRISSIEPNLLTDEVIELVANSSKFCPHFHIPMQSGSGKILRAMQRRYQSAFYRSRIEKIKALLPQACIGADVIVGFPGETEEDFQETFRFIESVDISYLHVFTFSVRPGTKAEGMPSQVQVEVRKERNNRLRLLSEKMKRAFYASQIGETRHVLVEQNGREGFSENYVRVGLDAPAHAELVKVKFGEFDGESLRGEVIEVLAERRPVTLLPILQ